MDGLGRSDAGGCALSRASHAFKVREAVPIGPVAARPGRRGAWKLPGDSDLPWGLSRCSLQQTQGSRRGADKPSSRPPETGRPCCSRSPQAPRSSRWGLSRFSGISSPSRIACGRVCLLGAAVSTRTQHGNARSAARAWDLRGVAAVGRRASAVCKCRGEAYDAPTTSSWGPRRLDARAPWHRRIEDLRGARQPIREIGSPSSRRGRAARSMCLRDPFSRCLPVKWRFVASTRCV
jgi:hypothetical protein